MRARSATYKFTGRPCKRGHVGPRYQNGNCVACLLEREHSKYVDDTTFRALKQQRESARYRSDVAGRLEYDRWYRANNVAKIKTRRRNHYRRIYDASPAVYLTRNALRRQREQQQLPAWADLAKIHDVYDHAQALRRAGVDVVVDHVVPLRGLRAGQHVVSGLHVHTNLQIVSRTENAKKGARRWPGMWP